MSSFIGCSPASIPVQPTLSDRDRLDLADPVFAVQASGGELRDNLEHLVREPADIENVLPTCRLRRRIRLKIDEYQPGPGIPRAEGTPLAHRCGASSHVPATP